MIERTPLLRWLAVSLYVTAILGAVVVPHEHHHHAGGGACCTGPECAHGHSSCDHSHGHACHRHEHGPASDPPSAPSDPECSVCRFLAQGAKLAEAPRITHVEALCIPAALPAPAEPIHRDEFAPPVRGPPAAAC